MREFFCGGLEIGVVDGFLWCDQGLWFFSFGWECPGDACSDSRSMVLLHMIRVLFVFGDGRFVHMIGLCGSGMGDSL